MTHIIIGFFIKDDLPENSLKIKIVFKKLFLQTHDTD